MDDDMLLFFFYYYYHYAIIIIILLIINIYLLITSFISHHIITIVIDLSPSLANLSIQSVDDGQMLSNKFAGLRFLPGTYRWR